MIFCCFKYTSVHTPWWRRVVAETSRSNKKLYLYVCCLC